MVALRRADGGVVPRVSTLDPTTAALLRRERRKPLDRGDEGTEPGELDFAIGERFVSLAGRGVRRSDGDLFTSGLKCTDMRCGEREDFLRADGRGASLSNPSEEGSDPVDRWESFTVPLSILLKRLLGIWILPG
jgi:hypothetical protein